MKTLFLVGESLPRKDATACTTHDKELAAIDGRHGVFPNLVGKPLLSALHWLHTNGRRSAELLDQLDALMTDASKDRRLNVFQKKAPNEDFAFHDYFLKRVNSFDPKQELWLTFGVQTNFGLVGYLLGRFTTAKSYSKQQIVTFSNRFIRRALTYRPLPTGLADSVPTQRIARLGLLHRLCCHTSGTTNHFEGMLRTAVRDTPFEASSRKVAARPEAKVDAIVQTLHGIVPLLHNEAYQDRNEIGYNQAHFVLGASVRKSTGKAPDMYWLVMGEAIGRRLQGDFVRR